MPGFNSIQGLASNLDIASIVDAYIQYERIPVTFIEQDKAIKIQQAAAYQAILARFVSLQTDVRLLRREASFNKADISVSDETTLTATARDDISTGTYNVRVLALATNHQMVSHGFTDETSTIFGTGTIQISVGEASVTTITIETGNNSLTGIKEAINNSNVGVIATVINDGSSSNSYRLMLSADKTGAINDINLTISLTGGVSLGFTSGAFDLPEETSFDTDSTSNVSLSPTAGYTGMVNKTYTFTVGGTGTQTVGVDNITIYWDDGSQSEPLPSILVTGADEGFELVGDGADGLGLSFSAGDLVAGDTFQVTAFGPTLQDAGDAQISVGGETSPITINSATNNFNDVLPGLSLHAKKISASGESVTITSDLDTGAIKTMIEGFVSKYNDAMDFIDDQFTYNTDKYESGVLFTEYSLQVMQSTIRSATTFHIPGLNRIANSLSAIGIRTGVDGKLSIVNSAVLTSVIENNPEDLVKLFTDSGTSSTPFIEFISTGEDSVPGTDYEIDITQEATHGFYQGGSITNPATTALELTESNNIIKFRLDGVISDEIVLNAGTYSTGEALANELQTRINSDDRIGNKGMVVEWVDLGDTGYLKITGGTYGSNSKVELITAVANSGFSAIGLSAGMGHTGDDVAGTINGEKATGKGQILTGDEDNPKTDGLKLRINLTSSQLVSGVDGTISFVKGLGSKLNDTLENITRSIDGSIARRTTALNKQIEAMNLQIDDYDERLASRREDLYAEFLRMEELLSQYQSQGSYLTTQLANISSNWNSILRK